jgi:phospholipid/cholesterol/gamma-HCH transport system substrate-binding protein
MDGKEARQNVKLGIFVVGGVVLFLVAIFYLGREGNVFNKTFTISAIFKNVEGLNQGDNVWLSGVKIGTVKRVQVVAEGKVVVDLSLKRSQTQFVKKDATAFVGTEGFVGSKIVIIKPGAHKEAIQDYDTINTLSPVDTQDLINLAKDVGFTTRSLADDLKLISGRLKNGEGVFGELLRDGPASRDLRDAISALKQTGEKASRVTANAEKMLSEVNNGDGLINKLLTDTGYAQTFQNTIQNIGEVGKNSKVISQNLEEMIAKMSSGDNAIGVLLTDTAFAKKLKNTLENAKSASAKMDENMEALQHNFLLRGYFRKQKKAQEKKKKG